MNVKSMSTTVCVFAAALSAAAAEPTSVITNGVAVVVSNVTDGATYTGTCRKEDGISTLSLWTHGHMYYKPDGVPTYEGGTELRRCISVPTWFNGA